jgi:hypothetical protein
MESLHRFLSTKSLDPPIEGFHAPLLLRGHLITTTVVNNNVFVVQIFIIGESFQFSKAVFPTQIICKYPTCCCFVVVVVSVTTTVGSKPGNPIVIILTRNFVKLFYRARGTLLFGGEREIPTKKAISVTTTF